VVLVLAPAAAGAAIDVGAPTDGVFVHGGRTATATFVVVSQDPQQAQHVSISVRTPGDGNWEATVVPAQTIIAAGDQREVTVQVVAHKFPAPRSFDLVIVASAVGADFSVASAEATVHVQATGTDQILGRWDNPLPPPFDATLGSFLLNFSAWLVIGLLTMWLVNPTLKLLTLRTKTDVDDRVIKIVSRPAFVLVFTFGIVRSLQVFPLPAWVFTTLETMWRVVLAGAIVYIAYRLWTAVVLAIGKRVAQRTESELDDRLYPVFEKVGGILILLVGVFYILGSFGVNLTLFAAGGAIGGLVVAFAAQDTLANFFAGIFIMLDRPFRTGDRIELPGQETWGDVQQIGLRTTRILTRDNRMVIMPNNVIGSSPIVNHTFPDPTYRNQVDFNLPYGSDVEFVRKILVEAVRPVPGVLPDKPIEALLLAFTDQGQQWRLRWWISSYVDTRRMFDRVNSAVIRRMRDENIRIAYRQITIWDAHELLERPSGGGLAPRQLTDRERTRLEHEAEASRQQADQQEAAELEAMREKAKQDRASPEEEARARDDAVAAAGEKAPQGAGDARARGQEPAKAAAKDKDPDKRATKDKGEDAGTDAPRS
jgi:small-conductance mechanosensitive channel